MLVLQFTSIYQTIKTSPHITRLMVFFLVFIDGSSQNLLRFRGTIPITYRGKEKS